MFGVDGRHRLRKLALPEAYRVRLDSQLHLIDAFEAHAMTSGHQVDRSAALTALVEACKVAYILAKRTGRIELAGIAAQRGVEAAELAERPDLIALMQMNRTSALLGVGARTPGRSAA
jgi:hypothetical protein